MLGQHRKDHRDAGRVESAGRTARGRVGGRDAQRLHLGKERSASLHRDGDAGAGHRSLVAGQEQAGRIGNFDDAVIDQVKTADLVDGAEAVLDGAQQAKTGAAIALELQHDVDEVLEDSWPGD